MVFSRLFKRKKASTEEIVARKLSKALKKYYDVDVHHRIILNRYREEVRELAKDYEANEGLQKFGMLLNLSGPVAAAAIGLVASTGGFVLPMTGALISLVGGSPVVLGAGISSYSAKEHRKKFLQTLWKIAEQEKITINAPAKMLSKIHRVPEETLLRNPNILKELIDHEMKVEDHGPLMLSTTLGAGMFSMIMASLGHVAAAGLTGGLSLLIPLAYAFWTGRKRRKILERLRSS